MQDDLLHAGERQAQRMFGHEHAWPDVALQQMIQPVIHPPFAAFMEAQPFFFIATANAAGACDASFRGTEYDVNGNPLPAVKVLDAKRLVFPDYQGNKLYNSIGNMLENPQIGMLFIDFRRQARIRVNGHVELELDRTAYLDLWPRAKRYIIVTVDQVYGNCRARIPRLEYPHE